jgi:hypothetical protein
MHLVMMTKAQNGVELERELRTFRATAKRNPTFIVWHHLMPYELAAHPKSSERGEQTYFDGVRAICLCELWDEESDPYGCQKPEDVES